MNEQYKEYLDRRKLLDPAKYRDKYYTVNIDIAAGQLQRGSGTIQLDNTPFLADRVTHCIFGTDAADQDGNYTLSFRDDIAVYTPLDTMAHALFGAVYNGNEVLPLPTRLFFEASKTITFDAVSIPNRQAGIQIQVCVHGFERWDKAIQWK